MKYFQTRKIVLGIAFFGSLLAARAEELHLVQTIPLEGVEGRIDHMSMDVKAGRLFVAALGNNTVEVLDLKQGKVVRSLSGFSEPQGVCFVPEFDLLAVANGGGGRCPFFDGTSFKPVGALDLGDDADHVRYDGAHKSTALSEAIGGNGQRASTIDGDGTGSKRRYIHKGLRDLHGAAIDLRAAGIAAVDTRQGQGAGPAGDELTRAADFAGKVQGLAGGDVNRVCSG